MGRASNIIFLFFFLLFSARCLAQDSLQEGVVVHADPRLSVLLRKTHTTEPIYTPGEIKDVKQPFREAAPRRQIVTLYKGAGYRVQIYNGPDRAKALQIKTEFMRHFPGVHTYLNYISPSFRVKVGDYRNRSDAAGMMREAHSMYSPVMIVPDMVTITNY